MKHKNLKSGFYTSPQSGETKIERYIIENQADLIKFAKVFNRVGRLDSMVKTMKECLNKGHIIIATDEHPNSGHPSYCFEATDSNNVHPSSFHRVKISA